MRPLIRHLPAALREPLYRFWRDHLEPSQSAYKQRHGRDAQASLVEITPEYAARIAAETTIFTDQTNVHDLPAIFHYWSNRHLRPILEQFGFSHPDDFFATYLMQACDRAGTRPARFISIGAGNCDTEVRIAQELIRRGARNFTLECLDINPAMLARGLSLARIADLEDIVRPIQGDFNAWTPNGKYDAVIANQSLHHVMHLEILFDAIHEALVSAGLFIASDMIGRNGHMLWPEALAHVHEFWRELPASYRYSLQLQRHEEMFMDWDCSVEGFEGIRAQDILPLLIERFGFELFLAFGNVVDPFIGRNFGHHFDANGDWDRAFVDRVHARDEAEILAGRVKPTHMLAVMTMDRTRRGAHWAHLTPEFCLRRPPA